MTDFQFLKVSNRCNTFGHSESYPAVFSSDDRVYLDTCDSQVSAKVPVENFADETLELSVVDDADDSLFSFHYTNYNNYANSP